MRPLFRSLKKTQPLPLQIHLSTVAALYSDARSLFAGSISSAVAALVTFLISGDITLLACAGGLVGVGVARGLDMRSYASGPAPVSAKEAQHWEGRYIIGSAAYVALLGLWCFLAFARTSDSAVHLIAFSVMLAYLVGIAGRNFSSDNLVVVQTTVAAVPMIAGLTIQGHPAYIFLALLLIPFFLSIRFISARLRGVLFDAVISAEDVKSLAAQFDTALNNMPHGLCMFDADSRLVVANGRFNEIMGLAPRLDRRGVGWADILAETLRSGRVSPASAERFASRVTAALSCRRRKTISTVMGEGQTVQLTFQPMETGGCVVLVEDITERRRAEAKIEHLARFDALTGLPNRTSFTDQLERALTSGKNQRPRAVLFVDLDEFKQVNDTLGHPCGDALLCEVAGRLRKAVRNADVVARFGGDEFVVLQTLHSGVEDAEALAARITDTLGEIYDVDGHQIVVGASIGITVTPQDGVNVDQLLKNADIALYRAKADGRGVWRFFEPEMDVSAQARRTLEIDLRAALAAQQFELHYQPIIDIKSGRSTSCEALLRWAHPERGMISPASFIPVAEEMGLIVDIGKWVLNQACIDCMKWPQDVDVAVNLSPIQFRRSNVETLIREALDRSGLAPERLEVEITETVLLQDTDAVRDTLQRVRDMGVKIALDDFGTGYSSLSYLHAFPLTKVKIDRSFLDGIETDPRAMTLLRGVARLSAELGMSVVMEGVETQQQLAALTAEKSVSSVQGYLFSPPVPIKRLQKFLRVEREDDAARVA